MLPASWNDLPVELLVIIFTFLQLADLNSVSRVCKSWLKAVGCREVWCRWQLMLTDNKEDLIENIEVLKTLEEKLKFATSLQVSLPVRRRGTESDPLLCLFVTSLLRGLGLQRHSTLQSFMISMFCSENILRRNRIYTRLLAEDISYFIKSQESLQRISVRDCYLTFAESMSVLESIRITKSGKTIAKIDLVNLFEPRQQYDFPTTELGNMFQSLVSLNTVVMNYWYLTCIGVENLCMWLRSTIKLLIVEVVNVSPLSELAEESGLVSTENWTACCRMCPCLKVEIIMPVASYVYNRVLVPGIPLRAVKINFEHRNGGRDLGDKATQLLYLLGNIYGRTLESLLISATPTMNTISAVSTEAVLFLLSTCHELKTFRVTPKILTPQTIAQVMAQVPAGVNIDSVIISRV